MYDFVDRPVSDLCNAGRFVLWAMRSWTQATANGGCAPIALGRGFAGVDATLVLPDFHMAMSLLNRESRETMAIAPVACCHIAENEAVLLALWRDLALGNFEQVRGMLELLVTDTAVSSLTRAMTTTAAKLLVAGFDLASLNPLNIED